MKLDMWEVTCIVVLWWVCATFHNYLDWTWQVGYDRAMQALYNSPSGGSGDVPLIKDIR